MRFSGEKLAQRSRAWAQKPIVTAARSPWQNPFVERLIGSIRRECLDHVIVWNESSLHRVLQNYFEYYERSRTHLALNKDAPVSRPVEEPANGRIVEVAQVGGLIIDTSAAPPSQTLWERSFAHIRPVCRQAAFS